MKIEEKEMEPRTEIREDDPEKGYCGKLKTVKEILDPRQTQYRPFWDTIFLICCVVAASLDPLFFYIPIINDHKKCVGMDEKLKTTILVLRSLMDLTYIFHIAFQIFSGYVAYTSETGGLSPRSDSFIDRIMCEIRRMNWSIIVIDVLCVLPIPQVIILVYFLKINGWGRLKRKTFLNFFVLIQFVPRIFRIHLSCKELTKNLTREISGAEWVKGMFNFFLYIIASHVMGAFWYLFSVQRETSCWYQACKGNSSCDQSMFLCRDGHDLEIIGYLNQSCPLTTPSSYDFGMFAPALQSGVVNTMDFPRKFFYCFAWGLRNLSSFGSNLQTSSYFWESLFSAALTIIGLLLFIYLIGNLQTYLQFLQKSRRKMKIKWLKVDMWMRNNGIPSDMRNELMDLVPRKMQENEDVNLMNLLRVLPTQTQKCIKQCLCLPILKKVPRIQAMDDKLIDQIFIDHLKPVIFNEHSKIVREGEPLGQMIFFTQGSAWAYVMMAGAAPVQLESGDFYGEELLEWALTNHSQSVPISGKTLKTITKVEGFALEAGDMKKIASSLGNSVSPIPPTLPRDDGGRV